MKNSRSSFTYVKSSTVISFLAIILLEPARKAGEQDKIKAMSLTKNGKGYHDKLYFARGCDHPCGTLGVVRDDRFHAMAPVWGPTEGNKGFGATVDGQTIIFVDFSKVRSAKEAVQTLHEKSINFLFRFDIVDEHAELACAHAYNQYQETATRAAALRDQMETYVSNWMSQNFQAMVRELRDDMPDDTHTIYESRLEDAFKAAKSRLLRFLASGHFGNFERGEHHIELNEAIDILGWCGLKWTPVRNGKPALTAIYWQKTGIKPSTATTPVSAWDFSDMAPEMEDVVNTTTAQAGAPAVPQTAQPTQTLATDNQLASALANAALTGSKGKKTAKA